MTPCQNQVSYKLQSETADKLLLIESCDAMKTAEFERHAEKRREILNETAKIEKEKKDRLKDGDI